MTPPERATEVRGVTSRVAILRALALGDLLCAVPALRAIRSAQPGAEITLIGLPWARTLVDRYPRYLDRFAEFPGFPGIPERPADPRRIARFFAAVHEQPYDLAIGLHGNGMTSNQFLAMLGAREMAGLYLPATWRPPGRFVPYPPHAHEIRRYLAVARALGADVKDETLELPALPGDETELAAALDGARLVPGSYAVIHPGARDPRRRWDPASFAAVGDALAADGLTVVVTGTGDERDATAAVTATMAAPALDLAGATSLGAVSTLVRDARLVVSNDTAISHLAAATRTPSVVVFLASDPDRWAPLDGGRHVAVGVGRPGGCHHGHGLSHRCLGDACAMGDPTLGPGSVSVHEVLAAVRRQLRASLRRQLRGQVDARAAAREARAS